MNLQEGIQLALSGQAILFVGAGFSVGAKNLRDTPLKTGKQLSKYLGEAASFDEEVQLDEAAEQFIALFGKDKLIDELQQEYTVSTVLEHQYQISNVPWKRIYTTNYDNLLEKAYSENKKKLIPVTSIEEIRGIPKDNTVGVHLNGYIDRLNRNTLMADFKLTETSYLTSSIAESPWATLFRDDIKSARVVFFIGYSLADLDIKRILFEHEGLKEKCFFILGENPAKTTLISCEKFGQIMKINTKSFANEIQKVAIDFVPPEQLEFWSSLIEKYTMPEGPSSFSDEYAFKLFLQGDVKSEFVADSMRGGVKYFLARPEIEEVMAQIQHEPSAVVVYSELGNGKTLLIEGLKFRATQLGYNVYSLIEKGNSLLEDIDELFKDKNKKLIIVDNYADWMDELRYVADVADDKCSLVLTSRTSPHEILIDTLEKILRNFPILEIPLDNLTRGNLDWLRQTFDLYGLWGEHTGDSAKHKMELLSVRCNAEFHAVLLEALKSEDIVKRLADVISVIQNKRNHYQVILSILILNVINNQPTVNRLVDYWGNKVLDSTFRQDLAVKQIVDFNKEKISLRSSVAAKHILQNKTDVESIVNTMISMARVSDRLSSSSPFHFNVRNLLLRFNSVQELLPEKGKRHEIIRYFENVKNLPSAKNYPLFWLQYAIACLVIEEFERAQKYFEVAYSLAETRLDFDVYQIDNQYARFLLIRATKQKTSVEDAMRDFQEAHRITYAQTGKERRYFPFRVAEMYTGFYDIYSAEMQQKHKDLIIKSANEIITRIYQLPANRRKEKHVRRCESNLQSLMERISGIDYRK